MDVQPSVNQPSLDGELVIEHLHGREEALEILYRRHHSRLVGYLITQVRSRDVAEDVAHDVFVRALTELETIQTDRITLWPWLKTIATHLVTDYQRRNAFLPTTVDHDEALEGAETVEAPDSSEHIADRDLLRQALEALPDRQRIAMTLKYLHDWSARDIGRMLNLTRRTTEQLLTRSRRRLCDEYRRLHRESQYGWSWPLLYPLWRLRDRLLRAHNLVSSSGHGPALAMDEVLKTAVAVAAAGAVAAAIGFGTGALAPHTVTPGRNNVHMNQSDGPTITQFRMTRRPVSPPVAKPAAGSASRATTTRQFTLAPPTAGERKPPVAVHGDVGSYEDEDGSAHPLVYVELSAELSPDDEAGEPSEGGDGGADESEEPATIGGTVGEEPTQVMVELRCGDSVRERLCDAADPPGVA